MESGPSSSTVDEKPQDAPTIDSKQEEMEGKGDGEVMDSRPSSSSGQQQQQQAKFIMPGEDEGVKEEKKLVHLSVDPDFVDDEEEAGDEEPQHASPISIKQAAIERRSREKEDGGVKMSIGFFDDDNDQENETEDERKMNLFAGIRNFRNSDRQEGFDLDGGEPDLSAFINQQVNNVMIFDNDNLIELDAPKKKEPKIIEGYLWGAAIGVGSYGKVKEVLDTFTLTRRAAKIMKYDKLKKISNGWDNIRSEMSILRNLSHRNVIKLIEVFDIPEKGKVYMIFEYCIGSVQQLLDLEPAKRLTIGESHLIFKEMVTGLDYLHSKRISHKDIKPGNLLISINFTIKICDFGVAEQICNYQSNGHCTKVNGTPKFQPPECVYGNHDYFCGYKADMWSAGVTLYNLVSGRYPFERPVLLKLYECIGTEPLVLPTNVQLNTHLEDLLKKLLEKDFTKRIGTHETMIHPWFISSYPEDQGLGRIMERMRTGDRPLTMAPSLTYMYDGYTEYITDEEGREVFQPPRLVIGGELDQSTFEGFKFLDASIPDGLDARNDEAGGGNGEEGAGPAPIDPARRASSRSMPTSAPPRPGGFTPLSMSTPMAPGGGARSGASTPTPAPPAPTPRRRRGGNLFSCIFRSRTDST